MASTAFQIHTIDENNKHANTDYYVATSEVDPGGTIELALRTAQAGISDGLLAINELIPFSTTSFGSSGTGPYDSSTDKVVLEFSDASGNLHHYEVPAPLDTIFLSDGKTVDRTNSLFAASGTGLIDTFLANVKGTNGEALTAFIRGYRDRARKRKNP